MIRLRVLGPVELHDTEGREFRSVLAQPKRLALLVCLVVGPRGFRRRDSLLALLWPELDQSRARAALNQAVRFLRKELGGSTGAIVLSRGADELGIDPDAVWCDAMVLRDHIEAGRFSDAMELYRGDLLEGFFADQGAGFQEWLERERELLRASAARAARGFAAAQEREQNFTPAVAAARRAVELSAADERVVRELLQLLDRLGDRAGAVQAYEEFARRLAQEYDANPAAETKALIDRIRTRVTPAGELGIAARRSPDLAGESMFSHLPRDDAHSENGASERATGIAEAPHAAAAERAVPHLARATPSVMSSAKDVMMLTARRGLWLLAGGLIGGAIVWLSM